MPEASTRLSNPGGTTSGGVAIDRLPPPPPALEVPGYEVLGLLGKGGMGVVYKARQLGLDRLVALKMLRDGYADEQERARLRTEALAVARLSHPNIVQVYEVGEHDHRPYLALELVEGGSLADRLAKGPLPPDQAASIAQALAGAVQHAHEHGIVHRDLKPANVLLDDQGNAPHSPVPETTIIVPRDTPAGATAHGTGLPKITDFGLARRLDLPANQTQSGAVLGTPSYMPPEQAAGQKEVGPAADVWALGATLYEMLTGRPPFQAASLVETLQHVLHADPVPPRALNPAVPRDLETICLKCLRKEPGRCYPSAKELGEDLGRYLSREPVLARPVGALERAWSWCRRNPLPAALVLTLALLVVTAFVASWVAAFHFREMAGIQARLAREAESANEQLVRKGYYRDLWLADLELSAGDAVRAERILEGCPEELRRWEWHLLRRRCRQGPVVLAHAGAHVESIAFSPDGHRLAVGGWDRTTGEGLLRLWDVGRREEARRFAGHPRPVHEVAFSPDGRRIASASADRTVVVWGVADGARVCTYRGHSGWVGSVDFSPVGKLVASCGEDRQARTWSPDTGDDGRVFRGHTWVARRVRFSPDGLRLATAGCDATVRLWEVRTGKPLGLPSKHSDQVLGVAFSPDGRWLASAGGQGARREARLWDARTGKEVWMRRGHSDVTEQVVFSPDSRCLASVSGHSLGSGVVDLWEVEGGQQLMGLGGHGAAPRCAAFSRDGRWLATGGGDGAVLLYDASPAAE